MKNLFSIAAIAAVTAAHPAPSAGTGEAPPTDVKGFCHQIKSDDVFGTHRSAPSL